MTTMAERRAAARRLRGVRNAGTGPERKLKAALMRLGIFPSSNVPTLQGSPDLVLLDDRIAVFVHGCFWHGCPEHYKAPRSRRKYWARKLDDAKRRDARAVYWLEQSGWVVIVAWECEVKRGADALAEMIMAAVKRQRRNQ